jgi:hypothetical protein
MSNLDMFPSVPFTPFTPMRVIAPRVSFAKPIRQLNTEKHDLRLTELSHSLSLYEPYSFRSLVLDSAVAINGLLGICLKFCLSKYSNLDALHT